MRYKDYRDHDRQKVMSLSGEELIRRFLLHVLPKGFMRIRHCGFLANRCRQAKLAQVRQAIGQAEHEATESEPAEVASPRYRCPHYGQPALEVVAIVLPARSLIPIKAPPRVTERAH